MFQTVKTVSLKGNAFFNEFFIPAGGNELAGVANFLRETLFLLVETDFLASRS